jgi:hypothetical protein
MGLLYWILVLAVLILIVYTFVCMFSDKVKPNDHSVAFGKHDPALTKWDHMSRGFRRFASLRDRFKKKWAGFTWPFVKKVPPSVFLRIIPGRAAWFPDNMRSFADVQREFDLVKQVRMPNGTLYGTAVAPGIPRRVIRRFDADLPPALIPAYADLLSAAQKWCENDRKLSQVVRVEPALEVGSDFISRDQLFGTNLSSFFQKDEAIPLPPEFEAMQSRFRALAASAGGPRDALIVEVLSRSILHPFKNTIEMVSESKFVVLDIDPTLEMLKRWERPNDVA